MAISAPTPFDKASFRLMRRHFQTRRGLMYDAAAYGLSLSIAAGSEQTGFESGNVGIRPSLIQVSGGSITSTLRRSCARTYRRRQLNFQRRRQQDRLSSRKPMTPQGYQVLSLAGAAHWPRRGFCFIRHMAQPVYRSSRAAFLAVPAALPASTAASAACYLVEGPEKALRASCPGAGDMSLPSGCPAAPSRGCDVAQVLDIFRCRPCSGAAAARRALASEGCHALASSSPGKTDTLLWMSMSTFDGDDSDSRRFQRPSTGARQI